VVKFNNFTAFSVFLLKLPLQILRQIEFFLLVYVKLYFVSFKRFKTIKKGSKMKRTIFLLSMAAFLSVVISGSFERGFTAEPSKTCCQKFLVQDRAGNTISGCTIKIRNTNLYCVTGDSGTCEICFINDALYTAEASCPGPLGGSVTFSPCVQPVVVIIVS
jgi:hypothetical protein